MVFFYLDANSNSSTLIAFLGFIGDSVEEILQNTNLKLYEYDMNEW